MEETVRTVILHSVLREQAVFKGGGSSEFFQIPGSKWRGKDQNFYKSKSLHEGDS